MRKILSVATSLTVILAMTEQAEAKRLDDLIDRVQAFFLKLRHPHPKTEKDLDKKPLLREVPQPPVELEPIAPKAKQLWDEYWEQPDTIGRIRYALEKQLVYHDSFIKQYQVFLPLDLFKLEVCLRQMEDHRAHRPYLGVKDLFKGITASHPQPLSPQAPKIETKPEEEGYTSAIKALQNVKEPSASTLIKIRDALELKKFHVIRAGTELTTNPDKWSIRGKQSPKLNY